MDQHAQPEEGDAQASPQCVFHPGVETGLSCSRCDRPICVRCMVQAPVGIRCRECAAVQPLPTFDVRPTYYLRASLVGAMVAVITGVAWGLVVSLVPSAPLAGMLAVPIGYAVGESISMATNRKRSSGLMILAVCYVVLSLCMAWVVHSEIFRLIFTGFSFVPLLMLVLAGYIAAYRLR